MNNVESLGLSANQWRFLSKADAYVEASGGQLLLESTRRQFLTARDILSRLDGCCGEPLRQGILLADDVGLGKTNVAALVAWVVASAGKQRNVRILAPNEVMARRWKDELESHVELLKICAPNLIPPHKNRVKVGAVRRLAPGSIQVVKHSYVASGENLKCDLLIVDEAHRAKGEHTEFARSLKKQKKLASRVLILTATPFSIQLDELSRMLTLIGAEHTHHDVGVFSRALRNLYLGSTAHSPESVAKKLADKAQKAIEAIRPSVIRHSIDDLPREQKALGLGEDWNITVPQASNDELEIMLRMDRMLRAAKGKGAELSGATNDPRFHVGWQHLDSVVEAMRSEVTRLSEPVRALVEKHLYQIRILRKRVGVHSKIAAVSDEIEKTINIGEKVVIFCHHHATAQELTVRLASVLPKILPSGLDIGIWREAWELVLKQPRDEVKHSSMLRNAFIEWLCSDLIRGQTESWIGTAPKTATLLANALRRTHARHLLAETIQQAAQRVYIKLLQSNSGKAVLLKASDRLDLLPGANGGSRVLGVCERGEPQELFIHNQQPDTVIEVFGSPFGPDVLVVTDKLSEGIDLHRYCRHLIHYELDPSPIRTVQRNGRIRRVNSWAAVTNQKIRYAYPAFGGTRDHRLVQIMKKRVDTFSLLLGGVQDFDVDETNAADEQWRSEVVRLAKKQLSLNGGKLRATEPGSKS
jgi:ERCC4-related helicase